MLCFFLMCFHSSPTLMQAISSISLSLTEEWRWQERRSIYRRISGHLEFCRTSESSISFYESLGWWCISHWSWVVFLCFSCIGTPWRRGEWVGVGFFWTECVWHSFSNAIMQIAFRLRSHFLKCKSTTVQYFSDVFSRIWWIWTSMASLFESLTLCEFSNLLDTFNWQDPTHRGRATAERFLFFSVFWAK